MRWLTSVRITFELIVELRLPPERRELPPIEYRVDVSVAEAAAKAPRVVHESLDYPLVFGKSIQVKGRTGFRTSGQEVSREANLDISFSPERSARRKSSRTYPPTKPVLYRRFSQGHRIKMGVFHKIGKSRHSD